MVVYEFYWKGGVQIFRNVVRINACDTTIRVVLIAFSQNTAVNCLVPPTCQSASVYREIVLQ